jgi:hypothetical protein
MESPIKCAPEGSQRRRIVSHQPGSHVHDARWGTKFPNAQQRGHQPDATDQSARYERAVGPTPTELHTGKDKRAQPIGN